MTLNETPWSRSRVRIETGMDQVMSTYVLSSCVNKWVNEKAGIPGGQSLNHCQEARSKKQEVKQESA